jgi:hypothetical protein
MERYVLPNAFPTQIQSLLVELTKLLSIINLICFMVGILQLPLIVQAMAWAKSEHNKSSTGILLSPYWYYS